MKSLKLLTISAIFIIAFFAISCKTTPQGVEVKPVDLLDDNASFYIKLPKKTDDELVIRILQATVANLSEKDAKRIANQIDTVYTGIYRTKRDTTIQAAISGSVPKRTVQNILKKDKSWSSKDYTFGNRPYMIFASDSVGMQLSFPSSKIACFAKDVKPMISEYDSHAFSGNMEHKLNDNVYNWLDDNSDEIRFYAPNPLSFLTILTGANLNLRLNYVKGSMITDPKNSEQFIMSIEFDFNNQSVVRVGKGMLSLAFGLTDSQVIDNSETNFTVQGIKISKQQLYKLFVL